jgi:hypothetical protein
MGDMTDTAGFYEDDEPLEKIEAAFERGVKRMTVRPAKNEPVAFSCNQQLILQGRATSTVAAVVTSTRR